MVLKGDLFDAEDGRGMEAKVWLGDKATRVAAPERGERGELGAAVITGGGAKTRGEPNAGTTGDPLLTPATRARGELTTEVPTCTGLVALFNAAILGRVAIGI